MYAIDNNVFKNLPGSLNTVSMIKYYHSFAHPTNAGKTSSSYTKEGEPLVLNVFE